MYKLYCYVRSSNYTSNHSVLDGKLFSEDDAIAQITKISSKLEKIKDEIDRIQTIINRKARQFSIDIIWKDGSYTKWYFRHTDNEE